MNEIEARARYPRADLDALVAVRVMGWRQVNKPGFYPWQGPQGQQATTPPGYSTDLAVAWRVVEHMLEQEDHPLFLRFVNQMNQWSWCAPAPLACVRICLAALAAVEGQE